MTDEKTLRKPAIFPHGTKTPEPIPDFKAMPFEELMSIDSKDDNDKFNNALWTEQSERFKKLGIADAELLRQVDEFQDEINTRLHKIEDKFEQLVKLIDNESHGILVPKQSLNQYLEGKTK